MDPKYKIDRFIARGGRAEVYKARMTLVDEIERIVAVKRIHPTLTRDRNFVTMFLDEARLSMLLTHANIVQVFDAGRSKQGYYLVMEYVEGANLAETLDRRQDAGMRVPLHVAAFIICEVLKALWYAHSRPGPGGALLGVIHRDVTPTNILLSRSGEVKLADFGLAKATTQLNKTAPGTVKGKVGYFSPESLVQSAKIDHRSDIFGTGIILWEAIAGRRLFKAENPVEVLLQIKAGEIPPLREFNADVDDEFAAIVHKALALDREQRFEHARAMGETLGEYLYKRGLRVDSWDVSDLVCEGRAGSIPPPTPPPSVVIDLEEEGIEIVGWD